MKKDYWNVSDDQVVEKTGKTIEEWSDLLRKYNAHEKKANDAVKYLQAEFNVPRYWARTLTTKFEKDQKT